MWTDKNCNGNRLCLIDMQVISYKSGQKDFMLSEGFVQANILLYNKQKAYILSGGFVQANILLYDKHSWAKSSIKTVISLSD